MEKEGSLYLDLYLESVWSFRILDRIEIWKILE